MRLLPALALAAALALPARADPGFARLEGHGGPVRSVAVAPDGSRALTTSFDNSVGVWSLNSPTHLGWLEGHAAAVNHAVFAGAGRVLSAGDDFALILWDLASGRPVHRMEGHKGKVLAVAVSPDGATAASASWDGSVGLWDLASGENTGWVTVGTNVNDVAFAADGKGLYTAGYDGEVKFWDLSDGPAAASATVLHSHGFGVNVIAVDEARGWLALGGLDGGVLVMDLATREIVADLTADRRPVLALALSPDRSLMAVGDGEGYIHVVRTEDWSTERDFHAVARGPVWALAFTGDGQGLISGGLDDFATVWPIAEAASVAETEQPHRFHLSEGLSNGERQFARKCSICHSLTPDGKRRAGPTLFGLFGRRAGSLEGYTYSDALAGSDIVWSAETIDLLFDLGPDHYTPGSKMPMQRITGEEDRADLIAYLREATKGTEQ